MCNAWNHSPSCQCGWGGQGHKGKGIPNNNSSGAGLVNFKRIESYTIPNAKCPVCGCKVFYYRSENGGSVFFNELGPPWPKHPCTDKQENKKLTPEPTYFKNPILSQWQKDGWVPVVIEHKPAKSIYAFDIERVDPKVIRKFDTFIYGYGSDELLNVNAIVFIKRNSENTFLLSLYHFNIDKSTEIECEESEKILNAFFAPIRKPR
jgi:hypothetical protein